MKRNYNIARENDLDLPIYSIEQKIEPIECLSITFEEKTSFSANEILFYSDRQVPAKFQWQDPISCRYGHCTYLNWETIRRMLISLAILKAGILSVSSLLNWMNKLKS